MMASAASLAKRLGGALTGGHTLQDPHAGTDLAQALPTEPTPLQRQCDQFCRQVLGAVQQAGRRSPVDVSQWLVAHEAAGTARQAYDAELSLKQRQDRGSRALQAARNGAIASFLHALVMPGTGFVSGIASIGTVTGAMWANARYSLGPLVGLSPNLVGEAVYNDGLLRQKSDAWWARDQLRQVLRLARDRLGAPPQVPPLLLPPPQVLVDVASARQALDACAAMLDAYRQRHHYVAATLRSTAAEATGRANGARNTLLAAQAGLGGRALLLCTAALATTFVVGLLHPLASVMGFVLSVLCLVGAGLLLATQVQRALRFLDGTLTEPADRAASEMRRHEALAAMAEQQGRQVGQAWALQQQAEAALAPFYAQLDALAAQQRALADRVPAPLAPADSAARAA